MSSSNIATSTSDRRHLQLLETETRHGNHRDEDASSEATIADLAAATLRGRNATTARMLVQTETRVDELGHGRDNDLGSESTIVDLAGVAPLGSPRSEIGPAQLLPSLILAFAQPLQQRNAANGTSATMTETFERSGEGSRDSDAYDARAMMTETFEKSGQGGRDNDAYDALAANGTETKVGDPTARDQDGARGSYSPIGNRRA